jgi:hypothetical protein
MTIGNLQLAVVGE